MGIIRHRLKRQIALVLLVFVLNSCGYKTDTWENITVEKYVKLSEIEDINRLDIPE